MPVRTKKRPTDTSIVTVSDGKAVRMYSVRTSLKVELLRRLRAEGKIVGYERTTAKKKTAVLGKRLEHMAQLEVQKRLFRNVKMGQIDLKKGEITVPADEGPVPADEVFADLYAKYGRPGAALKGARTKEDLTQAQLAEKLGITQGNVAAMESGKRPIGKDMAKRLGEALNIDYRVFL